MRRVPFRCAEDIGGQLGQGKISLLKRFPGEDSIKEYKQIDDSVSCIYFSAC